MRAHSLELRVFRFQLLNPLQTGHPQTAVLRFPLVVRRQADTVFATDLYHRQGRIRFLQNRNNLRLVKS